MLQIILITGTRKGIGRNLAEYYLAKEKISYKKFLLYDSLSTVIWIFGMGFVGYLVGIGLKWIVHVVKDIQLATTFVIGILVLFYIIQKLVNKGLFKEEKILEKKNNKKK